MRSQYRLRLTTEAGKIKSTGDHKPELQHRITATYMENN